MSKKQTTMRFDEELLARAREVAKIKRQSTTAFIETATEEKIKREENEIK
jgi:predicted transcriptional regulator